MLVIKTIVTVIEIWDITFSLYLISRLTQGIEILSSNEKIPTMEVHVNDMCKEKHVYSNSNFKVKIKLGSLLNSNFKVNKIVKAKL